MPSTPTRPRPTPKYQQDNDANGTAPVLFRSNPVASTPVTSTITLDRQSQEAERVADTGLNQLGTKNTNEEAGPAVMQKHGQVEVETIKAVSAEGGARVATEGEEDKQGSEGQRQTKKPLRPLGWTSTRPAIEKPKWEVACLALLMETFAPLLADLTPDNLQEVAMKIGGWANAAVEEPYPSTSRRFIELIFEAAINEAHCSELNARLLKSITLIAEPRFKTALAGQCQRHFLCGLGQTRKALETWDYALADQSRKLHRARWEGQRPRGGPRVQRLLPPKPGATQWLEERDQRWRDGIISAAQEAKRRSIAFGRFLVELYRHDLLTKANLQEFIEDVSGVPIPGMDAVVLFGSTPFLRPAQLLEIPSNT